jgi:hypothetical protein
MVLPSYADDGSTEVMLVMVLSRRRWLWRDVCRVMLASELPTRFK